MPALPAIQPPIPTLEAHRAPIFPLAATLVAQDSEALARFYVEKLGFERFPDDAGKVALGAGRAPFLFIENRPDARMRSPRDSGLFHIAYLVPSRAELARWFLAVHAAGAPFEGASDHAVSEAFYLTDPEGNGIEVYVDRARESWAREGEGYAMTTAPMAIGDLVATARDAEPAPPALPGGTRIGHIHLQVGDAAEAAAFWQKTFGMDETHRRPGARFLSWGGYHHHLGINNWQSRGSGPRDPGTTGLASLRFGVLEAGDLDRLGHIPGASRVGDSVELRDPNGIALGFRRA